MMIQMMRIYDIFMIYNLMIKDIIVNNNQASNCLCLW